MTTGIHDPWLRRASQQAFFGASALLFAASAGGNDRLVRVHVGDGRDAMPAAGGCRWRGCVCWTDMSGAAVLFRACGL